MEECKKRSILLVDDEQNNLDMMKRCLHNENYEITECANPLDALEIIKSKKFDLVLSDHKMPDMNGIQLMQKIDEYYPDCMKILVTAYSDADILIDSINKAKVFRYIKKPYSPNELKMTVTTAIDYLNLTETNKSLVGNLKDLFSGTINAIVEALDAKDSFTMGRSRRVTFCSLKIAQKLNLSSYMLGELELAGLLHDIGMIGVSDEILYKTEHLSDEEYEQIKHHVEHGIKILEDITQLKGVVEIIRHHHEHYNGSGYPDKLKGEDIPLLSRIIAVTDAFDSLVSNRVYRKSLTIDDAINIIKESAGKQFDPNIVDVFVKLIPTIKDEIKKIDL